MDDAHAWAATLLEPFLSSAGSWKLYEVIASCWCASLPAGGRTVTLTVRFADFTTITRSRTLPEATDITQEVYRQAVRSYDALGLQRARIRLVGVRVEGLVPRERVHRQLVLGERDRGWSEADRAADRVVRRFGPDAVRPASLLS